MCRTETLTVLAVATARRYRIVTIKTNKIKPHNSNRRSKSIRDDTQTRCLESVFTDIL